MPNAVVSYTHVPLAAALLVVAACNGSHPVVPDPRFPLGAVDVGWSDDAAGHVAHGYYSGFTAPARLVIDNDADWRAAWAQAYIGMTPTLAVPAIDFSRSSVIIVASGTHNTGGYDIRITRLATADDHLYAEVLSTSPGSGCITTQALTQPFDIVRIPKPTGTVVFVEHPVTHDC
jgi:hypothetical protein